MSTTFLKETPLAVLACYTHPTLVTVSTSATVGHGLKVLSERNIYAVPVVDDSGKAIGMLDLSDVTAGLSETLKGDGWTEKRLAHLKQHCAKEANEFFNKKVEDVMNLSLTNPFSALDVDSTSLYDAVQRFAQGSKRLAINDGDEMLTVVSPSLIVRFLAENISEPALAETLQKTIGERDTKSVVSINGSKTVAEAMILMHDKKVSALAVVSDDGKLYSTISQKDLKLIANKRAFGKLFKSVDEYVLEIRRKTPRSMVPVITCHSSDTIERALLRLAATRIHRLFVLDSANQPVDVLSVRDIIADFL